MASLMELAYHCALKTGELINLTIGDVVDNAGNIRNEIQIGEGNIGLTAFSSEQADSLTSLINRADEALYRAKKHGRNRVEVSK